jgi:hypothetical protein
MFSTNQNHPTSIFEILFGMIFSVQNGTEWIQLDDFLEFIDKSKSKLVHFEHVDDIELNKYFTGSNSSLNRLEFDHKVNLIAEELNIPMENILSNVFAKQLLNSPSKQSTTHIIRIMKQYEYKYSRRQFFYTIMSQFLNFTILHQLVQENILSMSEIHEVILGFHN